MTTYASQNRLCPVQSDCLEVSSPRYERLHKSVSNYWARVSWLDNYKAKTKLSCGKHLAFSENSISWELLLEMVSSLFCWIGKNGVRFLFPSWLQQIVGILFLSLGKRPKNHRFQINFLEVGPTLKCHCLLPKLESAEWIARCY